MALYDQVGLGASASSSAPGGTLDDADGGMLPIFVVEHVQLQFSIAAAFVGAQVANNVLVLALSNGRILRIDLNRPEDIDDIDLPKKTSEIGVIRRLFLDPTASHLIICTALGENYYLHSQSKTPRPLGRLRNVSIESVAWNPSLPTASTREILIGASDGNIYEVFIETSTEFYRKEVKHLKTLHKLPDGPITGLWVDAPGGKSDIRRVLIATPSRLLHLSGRIGNGHDTAGSVYTKLFDGERPVVQDAPPSTVAGAPSMLVVSPDIPDTAPYQEEDPERAFAWLTSEGVFHGKLLSSAADSDELGERVFAVSKLLPRTQLAPSNKTARKQAPPEYVESVALTQWHIVSLIGNRVVATNRLTGEVVYDQAVIEQGQKALGFSVDLQKNTFWLFTTDEIFEIVVHDEDRNIWQIMLKMQQYDAALQYAKTQSQKQTVATAYGDYLTRNGHFVEAATVYGRSNKPFEEVALSLIDANQPDALRKYLLSKLAQFKSGSIMQRTMVASWLVEIFMARLNALEDNIVTRAELSENMTAAQSQEHLQAVQGEYRDFITRYKGDLDRRTTYDIISSHAREEELLFYATAIDDFNYILSYWVQRERWSEALAVLKKQTDADVFYRYSTVLMTHAATDLVEILMRHAELQPRLLIPALLEYSHTFKGPPAQSQAIRYLQYAVNQLRSTDAAVHNTLVSLYATHSSREETGLLSYLESQGDSPRFDLDFALRLCIQHHRTLSCVHIYTNMGQYAAAVDLALAHGEVELAAVVADRPAGNTALRKQLWLAVARKVIAQADGIKAAIDFLKRCDLLRIEDLIPFFPDFVVIDDFKEEICAALEDYSRNIDGLRREMDEASQTAAHIKVDIAALDRRYAIVEPGEKCYVCGLPLLSKQFFVFPCQHAFHSDCLGRQVLDLAGAARSARIRDLQVQIGKGLVSGPKREAMIAELDALVGSACILCSDFAIKRIDESFVSKDDDLTEWAL